MNTVTVRKGDLGSAVCLDSSNFFMAGRLFIGKEPPSQVPFGDAVTLLFLLSLEVIAL